MRIFLNVFCRDVFRILFFFVGSDLFSSLYVEIRYLRMFRFCWCSYISKSIWSIQSIFSFRRECVVITFFYYCFPYLIWFFFQIISMSSQLLNGKIGSYKLKTSDFLAIFFLICEIIESALNVTWKNYLFYIIRSEHTTFPNK